MSKSAIPRHLLEKLLPPGASATMELPGFAPVPGRALIDMASDGRTGLFFPEKKMALSPKQIAQMVVLGLLEMHVTVAPVESETTNVHCLRYEVLTWDTPEMNASSKGTDLTPVKLR